MKKQIWMLFIIISCKTQKQQQYDYSKDYTKTAEYTILEHCCPIKNHGMFIFLFIMALNEVLACFSLFLSTVLRIR
jgi:hypothetical protein